MLGVFVHPLEWLHHLLASYELYHSKVRPKPSPQWSYHAQSATEQSSYINTCVHTIMHDTYGARHN